MPTVDTTDSNLEYQLESGVVEGLGFTIGGVLFGLLVVIIGGTKMIKELKKAASL